MPEERKIVVIEPEGPEEWYSSLSEAGNVEFYYPQGPIDQGVVREVSRNVYGAIITSSCGFSAEDMEVLPSLRIIAKCGGKPSSVDIPAATKKGIAVTYVPGSNSTTVAEFTVMLVLDCLRRFPFISKTIGSGLNRNTTDMFGRELRGKIVGLVGYRAIGRKLPADCRASPAGSKFTTPFMTLTAAKPEYVSFRKTLEDILPRVVCAEPPLHPEWIDHDMISEKSTGDDETHLRHHQYGWRAQLIDESAMEKALREERLAFAALDVFEVEPPGPDHPLLDLENVILTPHLASWTPEALHREVRGAVESVLALSRGEEIPGLINPEFRQFGHSGDRNGMTCLAVCSRKPGQEYAPARTDPIWPATFAPTACIRRKLSLFSAFPMRWITLADMGKADIPAAPTMGLIFFLRKRFNNFAASTPAAVSRMKATRPKVMTSSVTGCTNLSPVIVAEMERPRSRVTRFASSFCAARKVVPGPLIP